MERAMAVFCAVMLVWASCTCSAATGTPQSPTADQSLKERAALIPTGSVVVVKMRDKRTITGRIGSLNDDGFELQFVKDNKVVTETLAFSDMKSLKLKTDKMSKGAQIAVGTLATFGVIMLIFGIACAAGGCYD